MATIAIIGTGWGARVQIPAFREAGLQVVGIAGFNNERTARLASELGVDPFDDWKQLVARRDVDLVTIVTPPSEHLAMATAALDAGKHVVSEKPTALDAGEARQLVEAAQRHPDRLALIDHELRFLPGWRAARERIDEIGALRYAEVRYASPGRGDRSREWNWWSDATRGGGIWGAVGSHFIDTFRYLGVEFAEAQATLHVAIDERPFDSGKKRVTADDVALVHLRTTSGAVVAMTIGAVASGPDEASTITLHGESGGMRLVGEELLMTTAPNAFRRVAGGELQKRPGNSPGGAFGSGTVLLGEALRKALDEGDRSALSFAATFADGLEQQRVLDAARRSQQEGGRWVAV